MLKALILTNQLYDFCGSELVTLEVATVLKSMGYEVDVMCNFFGGAVAPEFERNGIHVSDKDEYPNIFDYDFVWSMHNMLVFALAQHPIPDSWKTYIVSAHLSPYEPYELIGVDLGMKISDLFVANSQETALKIIALGASPSKVTVFHNACPDTFWIDSRDCSSTLRSVLVVSNHMPPEVGEALALVREQGIATRHIGVAGEYRLVTPEDVLAADAVVSIGKTVQYAAMAGTPVYCYDRFGGPGWLLADTIKLAEALNFSGRGFETSKTSHAIAQELVEGYGQAAVFFQNWRRLRRDTYSLDRFLAEITGKRHEDVAGAKSIVSAADIRRAVIPFEMLRTRYRHDRAQIGQMTQHEEHLQQDKGNCAFSPDAFAQRHQETAAEFQSLHHNIDAIKSFLAQTDAYLAKQDQSFEDLSGKITSANQLSENMTTLLSQVQDSALENNSLLVSEKQHLLDLAQRVDSIAAMIHDNQKTCLGTDEAIRMLRKSLAKRSQLLAKRLLSEKNVLKMQVDSLKAKVGILEYKNSEHVSDSAACSLRLADCAAARKTLLDAVAVLRRLIAEGSVHGFNRTVIATVFDEETYLSLHRDVAQAVEDQIIPSGFYHWLLYGIDEMRKITPDA